MQAFNIIKDLQTLESEKKNGCSILNKGGSGGSGGGSHKTILPRLNSDTIETMWDCLGRSALSHGFVNVAEKCLQITKEFDKLTLLYYVIGQREYMEKLAKISEKQNNWERKYHIAILLNDIPERINILKKFGHLPLAISLAHTYGYNQIKEELLSQYSEAYSVDGAEAFEFLDKLKSPPGLCMPIPCFPILPAKRLTTEKLNWPRAETSDGLAESINDRGEEGSTTRSFDKAPSRTGFSSEAIVGGTDLGSSSAQPEWGDDMDSIDVPNEFGIGSGRDFDGYAENSGFVDCISGPDSGPGSEMAQPGPGFQERVMRLPEGVPNTSSGYSVINLVVAGRYEDALGVLQRKFGVKGCQPYAKIFKMIALSSTFTLPSFLDGPSLDLPLVSEGYRLFDETCPGSHISPMTQINEQSLTELVKTGQKLVTAGKFQSALDIFQQALLVAPLIVEHLSIYSHNVEQLKQLLELVCQYCVGMRLELARMELLNSCVDQSLEEVVIRNLELISYFSCCKLLPLHSSLVLRRAMGISWKHRNYITTASFARRLLSLPNSEDTEKTHKILAACEQKATDEYNIKFDPHRDVDHIVICSSSLTKIDPKSQDFVKCPVCSSNHLSQFTGEICPNCNAGEVGLRVIGIF